MPLSDKVKDAFKNGRPIRIGLTSAELKGNKLIITHNGNMGNSIEKSVNPNLKIMGIPDIDKLKNKFKVVKEKGSPDYSYKIEFNLSKK